MSISFPISADDLETLSGCPACGGADTACVAVVQSERGADFFTTDFCLTCGLIFRRRRPTADWFRRMWQVRHDAQRQAGTSPNNETIEKQRYTRYAATAKDLLRFLSGRRVIDVGCGPATGLRAFADAGLHATGLEPDRSRAQFVRIPGVSIVEQTVEEYASFHAEQFDAATCQHSLEHFHQLRPALAAIVRMVVPGGVIYLEVPDWQYDVRDWNDALYLAHQTNFTAETLTSFAAGMGLEVIDRLYPPASAPGETHLALMFRRSPHAHTSAWNASRPKLADVQHIYRQGLGEVPHAFPLRFVVPEINDLSLTFKGNPAEVLDTVRENFAGRTVVFDEAAGAFRVRSR